MRAGGLRHKVKVQSAASSTSAFGSDPSSETYTTVVTTRARISPLNGSELFRGQQLFADVTTEIGLRYETALASLSPKYRIVDANSTGTVYDIGAVINPDERNREFTVLARERV